MRVFFLARAGTEETGCRGCEKQLRRANDRISFSHSLEGTRELEEPFEVWRLGLSSYGLCFVRTLTRNPEP